MPAFIGLRARLLGVLTLSAAPAFSQTSINLPDSLYFPGDTVTWVKRVRAYCEGPAYHPRTGEVTFTQIGDPGTAANRPHWPLWRVNPGVDTGGIFYHNGQGNGQILDPQGRLVVIQRDVVVRFERYDSAEAKVDTLVASGKNGVSFNANNNTDRGAGNDITFGSDGSFYFTNLASNVYYVDTTGTLRLVVNNASSANGIYWDETQGRVYVNEGGNLRFYVRAADGSLSSRTIWASQQGMGADGMCVDAAGNHWVADYSQGMLRVFDAAGQQVGNITMRAVSGVWNARPGNAGNASNCAFGGPDLKTLYITGDGGLFSLRVKVPGRTLPGLHPVALRPQVGRGTREPERRGFDGPPRDALGRAAAEDTRLPLLKTKAP